MCQFRWWITKTNGNRWVIIFWCPFDEIRKWSLSICAVMGLLINFRNWIEILYLLSRFIYLYNIKNINPKTTRCRNYFDTMVWYVDRIGAFLHSDISVEIDLVFHLFADIVGGNIWRNEWMNEKWIWLISFWYL